MQTNSIIGISLVIGAGILWGTTGTAQSFAPALLAPYWVGALRLATACAFFAGYVVLTVSARRLVEQVATLPWRWVLLAGACIAAYNLTFFAGVKAAGIATGTAIAIGSGPVWAGLLQGLVTGNFPRFAWWAGTSLAVAGGALIVAGGSGNVPASPTAIMFCLAAGFSYAAYTLINKRLVSKADPATVTLCVFLTAASLAVFGALFAAGDFSVDPAGWAVIAYLGVVPTGIAYLLFSNGLQRISGATGVTLALTEPLTAFLLALVVAHERPALGAYLGLLVLLAGLARVIRTEVKSAAA